jgi:hypothetical protein
MMTSSGCYVVHSVLNQARLSRAAAALSIARSSAVRARLGACRRSWSRPPAGLHRVWPILVTGVEATSCRFGRVAGYGTDVDLDVIRAWWSLRSLRAVRWLVEHGFDPWPEVAILRSQL